MQAQSSSSTVHVPIQGSDAVETARSGVSWGAILAGAAAATALSLVLYLLGSGLGLSAASPWSDNSGVAFGIGAILWLTLTQLAASAIGGYMAGRLRVKWASLHTDEVYFRDTAHGLLAWAVSTMLAAALFSGVISKMTGTAVDAGAGVAKATMASGAAAAAAAAKDGGDGIGANPLDYFSDMMLRTDKVDAAGASGDLRQETMRILANSIKNGSLAADDRAYLANRIAARTGLDQAAAEKRVDDVYARGAAAVAKAKATAKEAAKEAADTARKAAAATALWLTVAMLIGAFVASWCATLGGKLRDGVAGVSHR